MELKPLEKINWDKLVKFLEEEKEFMRDDDDFDSRLVEAVLTTVYGENVWEWWNSKE